MGLQDCAATPGLQVRTGCHELSCHRDLFVARAYDPSVLAPADTGPPDAYEDRSHTAVPSTAGGRVAIHNVDRHTHLTAEHQKKRGFASRWVSARIIGQIQPPELAFPVEGSLASSGGQHIEECAVESLDQAVRLGMVGGCSGLDHSQESADFGNHIRLEVASTMTSSM